MQPVRKYVGQSVVDVIHHVVENDESIGEQFDFVPFWHAVAKVDTLVVGFE